MYTSLIYKEWIKTRRIVLLLAVLFIALVTYIFLWVAQLVESAGAVSLWENIIGKDMSLVGYIKFLPPVAGILLAIAQFVPEMQSKRLKLTLHLPLKEQKIIFSMLSYGLCVLFVIFALSCATLMFGIRLSYAREIVLSNFWTLLPWFVGGLLSYLLSAWICLEPVWKQRIFYVIIAACLLFVLYTNQVSGAYSTFVPYMLVLLAVSFFFSLYSTERFKNGEQ